ncbi:uncharacterized protein LOC101718860 isoform X3 [Heterocephalus glaber]|uniref:Uncharacterized protein LOC101708146 isoform X2 n=1 Tax=Heterocephalus glaber TaxID=10181 RepID=A0AAX6RIR7_HETGA|nr:uncharacterized protein LOC101708146 isoform X2 [Heterocephalus glaber]XP_021096607.1 uncharacterized protein LOC101718860 isoform X3 [Heterocephalus glaber]
MKVRPVAVMSQSTWSQRSNGLMEKQRQKRHWAGPHRVAFLAAILLLLLLQVKGAKTQKSSTGPEEGALEEKTPPAGSG